MHSRLRSAALKWLLAVFGALVVAIVLIVVFFDWNWLKRPLESRLSSLTGKQVHIDGRITGSKAWVPDIVIPNVRIDAPEFTAAPHVATIDRVEVKIDLGQLLQGKLSFPLIDIEKPVLDLLRTPDGKTNWNLATDTTGPSSRSDMPLIGDVKIADGKLIYADPARRVTIRATIADIGAHGGNGQGDLSLDGHGVYRNAPFTIRLKGGSLDELRDTRNPYRVNAAASVGKTRVSIDGTVTDPFKLTDMYLKLTADGDNAADLYPIFGLLAPSTPPYHLVGTLDRDGKAWLFKNFSGTIGRSDLSGNLRADPDRPRLLVSGTLVSKNLDFADLGMLVGAPGDTTGDRPVSDTQRELASRYAKSDRVLPDAPLNLDEVRTIDADVTYRAEHVQAQTLPLEDVNLHLKLNDAVLKLVPLDVGVAGGRIESNITIDARSDAVATDYDIRFKRFQIAQFFQKANASAAATGFLNGRVRLQGTGDSVRKSLGSANGQASAIVDKGTISNLAAGLLGLDIVKSLGVLITGDNKQVPVRCMVADFEVKDGVMRPRAFVLDTDQTLVTASGAIDLSDEHLDLSVSGQPKDATLALGGPILIGGTFKSPTVGLGAAAIARGGAAVALGVLLTPIAAAIGFIDTGDDQTPDCQGLEQRAQSNAAMPPPRGPAKAAGTHGGRADH
jgi:uncharacterized protein involved in outer membrane biogenesis